MMIENSTTATIATDNDSYAGFVLAQLGCAALRARLVTAEIDSITVALRGGFIAANDAIAWAADIGIDLIAVSSAIIPSESS
jgi:hypothetical protein